MTRSDIYDLIAIIDECKKEEQKFADGYIKLNPDDAKRRSEIAMYIQMGMDRVWQAINEKYRYLKEA